MALRLPFASRQAQCVKAFLLKPTPFCKLSAGLGRTNKSFTFLRFSSQTVVLFLLRFPHVRFFFYFILLQILQELSFISIRLQWVSGHSFLPENSTVNVLVRQVDYSNHPLVFQRGTCVSSSKVFESVKKVSESVES